MFSYTPLIVLFPLIGFLFLGLVGSRIKNEKLIGIIGSGTVGLSFLVAAGLFFQMIGLHPEERKHVVELFTWISAFTGTTSSFSVAVAYQVDQLSILMTLIVTGVGFLIHVYSIGYMHGDPGFWRFFTYMNLFIFAMLNLVLADNFLLMFLGWEGVGLCSYLLIGFWYEKKFTGDAAKKAFVVNRIGDFGFLLGMFLIFVNFQSLNFDAVFGRAAILSPSTTMVWITLLLFVGATGKSAQIPLYVWLPDAMAGPTPVSALIHAATMVTAGVYMVARCSILFALAPATMEVVAIVGALTAIFAASIGLVQNDIKKVLAYSTISQLGYMFLAMGVAAFTAGIFHLMTHAFFKALLFLGSGAVIHGMHDEQDIQKMGGLKKYMPTTYRTFVIGAIAIAGIPPFAGFFSKDEILWKTFSGEYGSILLWVVGALGAGLTAFYMFRLVSLTFEGDERFDHHHVHPHEAPKTMTVVLQVLALLSIVGGFVGIPESLFGGNAIEHWLEPIFAPANDKLRLTPHAVEWTEYALMVVSVGIAVPAIYAARTVYLKRAELAEQWKNKYASIYKVLLNKYFVDEAYDTTIINPTVKISEGFLWKGVDVSVIDGAVNGSAKLIALAAQGVRRIQTGVIQQYATVFVGGIVLIMIWLILK
ncbi:MAG: NADH-quinone oxidoreductase subunit L [Ignavibacteriales bacterium]|nr:NADH-quinone oxidoreductase subunit L [Ignavibacteriales bacterium]MBI3789174.1 NADH-quinone oxidoreductase subunit L [Ignavibacteriales bacterium]